MAGISLLILFFLAVASAADRVSKLFHSTMWNQTIPNNLRGRLAGNELISDTARPQLSKVRAGARPG